MICVYDIGNDRYESNGNAILHPIDGTMKQVAGGNYEITMVHPIDPEGKWEHLVPGAILKVPVPEEEIENAFAGYEADVYRTLDKTVMREGPTEPTAITYTPWYAGGPWQVGSKVTVSHAYHKNWKCTYYDPESGGIMVTPQNSSWWTAIPDMTSGAAVLVTLAKGTELYLVEVVDSTWYKMSTYYGIVGYVKRSDVVFVRHLSPSETKPRIITTQLFRIGKPTVNSKERTVTVNAKHVSYDLNGILIQNVKISQASPAMALGKIAEDFMIPYAGTIATNLTTDENGTYTGEIKGKNGTFALLDPDQGIVSKFDAAYKRDNWDLFVMKKTEVDRGFRIKYRKNMLGVSWSRDADNLVTRVVPVAKTEKGDDLYLPEKWIDSSRINDYPVIKMERLSVKGQVGKDKGLGDDSTWSEADLLNEMRTKARERFSVDKADEIAEEITVDFELLGETDEYKQLKGLEKALLYDKVTVENDEIGLEVKLYVSELEWDFIRQKIKALKLVNVNSYAGKNTTTGYQVQAKSIGSGKLSDDVAEGILEQVSGMIPQYADPDAKRPASNVVDNLTSTSTTDALSANQGRVLNESKAEIAEGTWNPTFGRDTATNISARWIRIGTALLITAKWTNTHGSGASFIDGQSLPTVSGYSQIFGFHGTWRSNTTDVAGECGQYAEGQSYRFSKGGVAVGLPDEQISFIAICFLQKQ